MKFRKTFVTNSSSSSYVCDICGRSEVVYDDGLSDVDMMQCVNGHTFCCDEALPMPSKEEMIKMILENGWNDKKTKDNLEEMDECSLFDNYCSESGYYEIPECMCPICQFIEYSQGDLSEYLLKEYGITREEVFAEVKKINKRRKKLYDNEYITYVCNKFNLNPIEIVAGWKERFGTYHDFHKWLRS